MHLHERSVRALAQRLARDSREPYVESAGVLTPPRESLADTLQNAQPQLVEALALDLFSHQILTADHFKQHNGGVYLNDEGRRKFLLQYERRMERQFMSECVEHRTSLRQQVENQAVMFKAALEESARFEPFLMN